MVSKWLCRVYEGLRIAVDSREYCILCCVVSCCAVYCDVQSDVI